MKHAELQGREPLQDIEVYTWKCYFNYEADCLRANRAPLLFDAWCLAIHTHWIFCREPHMELVEERRGEGCDDVCYQCLCRVVHQTQDIARN